MAAQNGFGKLLQFLDRLEAAKIPYNLQHIRDSIMILLSVPGERWEIEFFEDCRVEFERFISPGMIDDESKLDQLLTEYINS